MGIITVQEAETLGEAADKLAIAFVRSLMVPELKNYLDLGEVTDMQRFLMKAEEWERSQPDRKHIFKQQSGYNFRQSYHQGNTGRQGHKNSFATSSLHVSPQCPKKPKGKIKSIQIPTENVRALGSNKVLAEISGTQIPLTLV